MFNTTVFFFGLLLAAVFFLRSLAADLEESVSSYSIRSTAGRSEWDGMGWDGVGCAGEGWGGEGRGVLGRGGASVQGEQRERSTEATKAWSDNVTLKQFRLGLCWLACALSRLGRGGAGRAGACWGGVGWGARGGGGDLSVAA